MSMVGTRGTARRNCDDIPERDVRRNARIRRGPALAMSVTWASWSRSKICAFVAAITAVNQLQN